MPIPFLLSGKEISIPCGYHELSLQKFISLSHADGGILSTLEILTGIPKSTWSEVTLTNQSVEALNISLDWSNKKCNWNKFPVPDKVKLKGEVVKIPARLDIKPFGMLVDFKERILAKASAQSDSELAVDPSLMGVCIAICLNAELNNKKYDSDTLGDVIKEVEQLPVTQAIPLFNFFLTKWWGFARVKVKSNTPKMKIVKEQEPQTSHSLKT